MNIPRSSVSRTRHLAQTPSGDVGGGQFVWKQKRLTAVGWVWNLAYLKKVVEKLKEKGADEATIKKFQTGATNYYTNHIKPNFKDFDFYTGESMDPDGMCVSLFHPFT